MLRGCRGAASARLHGVATADDDAAAWPLPAGPDPRARAAHERGEVGGLPAWVVGHRKTSAAAVGPHGRTTASLWAMGGSTARLGSRPGCIAPPGVERAVALPSWPSERACPRHASSSCSSAATSASANPPSPPPSPAPPSPPPPRSPPPSPPPPSRPPPSPLPPSPSPPSLSPPMRSASQYSSGLSWPMRHSPSSSTCTVRRWRDERTLGRRHSWRCCSTWPAPTRQGLSSRA